MSTARRYTTKLPAQLDKGDMIVLQGGLLMEIIEQPRKPDRGEPWLIKTDIYPKGCVAPASLRIPVVRDNPTPL